MPEGVTSRAQAVERPRAVEFNLVEPSSETISDRDTGIDIIAIHGLDAKSPETWAYKESDGRSVNWLIDSEMLPKEVSGTRIYTCNWPAAMFETRDSVPFGIEELATSLLHGLLGLISGKDRRLFFIASCLGGVILMKTLVMAKDSYKTIQEATRGIIFLATPFRGTSFADIAEWAKPGLSALATIQDRRLTGLLDWVKSPDSKLVHLVCEFTGFCLKRREEDLEMATFYEKRYTRLNVKIPFLSWFLSWFLSNKRKLLVDMDSATLDCVPMRIPLDRTHGRMNKFRADEADYRQIVGAIRGFIDVIRTGTLLEQADAWIREKCYTEERLKIERLSGKPVDKGQSYINLAIVKQPERGTSAEDNTNSLSPFTLLARQKLEMPAADDDICLTKIFDKRKRSDDTDILPRRILIRGRAGIGKTTLCKKIVHDFMKNEMWNTLFDRVLWIPLRNLKQHTHLRTDLTTFFDREFFRSSEKDRIGGSTQFAKALQKTLSHNRTLFILDGWDEVVSLTDSHYMSELLSILLGQPNVIITSRPSARLPHDVKVDLELETIGFNEEQINEYIDKVHKKNVGELKDFLRGHELVRGLVRIPIQLDAFCYCWDDIKSHDTENPDTMTSLYQAIQTSLWRKDADSLERAKVKSLATAGQTLVEKKVEPEVQFLEYLAFSGLATDRIEFNINDRNYANEDSGLLLLLDESLPRLSFLRTSDQSANPDHQLYHFIHLTFQEYFAARYFVRFWKDGVDMKYSALGMRNPVRSKERVKLICPHEFLRQNKYNAGYDIMWRFVAGLLDKEGRGHELFDEIEKEPLDLLGPSHQRLIMHCLSEVAIFGTEPKSQRHFLEERLKDWLLFECHFRENASLAGEAEFPDTPLQIALQQGQIEAKQEILQSIGRRTFSQDLSEVLVSLVIGDHSELTYITLKALIGVSTLRQKEIDILIGLLDDNKDDEKNHLIMGILMNQCSLSDKDSDALVKSFHKICFGRRRKFTVSRLWSQALRPFAKAFVKNLSSTEVPIHRMRDLGLYGRFPEIVIEVISEQLADQHPSATLAALKALWYHRCQLPTNTIQAITQHIEEDRQSDIQIAAMRALHESLAQVPANTLEVVTKKLEKQTDPGARKSVINSLVKHRSLTTDSVRVISKQLEDTNDDVQQAALIVLVRQLALFQAEIKAIIEHLKQRKTHMQENMFKSIKHERLCCTELLISIVETFGYSEPVLEFLKTQLNLSPAMIDAITAQLETAEPEVQEAMLEVFRHQSDLPQATIQAMIELLENAKPEVQKAVLEVFRIQSDLPPATMQAMIELLENSKLEVQRTAITVFQSRPELPEAAHEKLKALLVEDNCEMRKAVLGALPVQSQLSQTAVEAVVGLLHDTSSYVRETALLHLQNQRVLQKETVDMITECLVDPEEDVRSQAVRTLGAHSPLPYTVLSTISSLPMDEQTVRWAAQDVLSQPVLPKVLVDAIIRRIEIEGESSQEAIKSLFDGKPGVPETEVQILDQRLEDAATDRSQASIIALVSQPILSEPVINSIVKELDDSDLQRRTGMLKAFKQQRGLPQELIEAVVKQLAASELNVRESALEVLKLQFKLLPTTEEAITELLNDPNTEMQKAALDAFRHGRHSALPRQTINTVARWLECPDEKMRASALEVLARQLELSQEHVTFIIDQLEKTEGRDRGRLDYILQQQPEFVEAAINMFAGRKDADAGTETDPGAAANPSDGTIKFLCEIMIRQGFEESLSLYVHDNAVWVDDRSGRRRFDFDANISMVDRVRRCIDTSRPDGYPLETFHISTTDDW